MGDPVFEQELELILSQYEYTVIYFNNGLHGVPFSIEQYESALDRVFKRLLNTNAVVIWRDITLYRDDHFRREQIDQRNAIAARLAVKYNIEIDNLGTFVPEDYIDIVHFNATAIEMQAKYVMGTIYKNIKSENELSPLSGFK